MGGKESLAEFIGIMLGDGNIGRYNTRADDRIKVQHRIKVTLDSRNLEYIGYVYNMFKKVLNVEPRIYFKKDENAVDIATFIKDKFNYLTNEVGLKISPKINNMIIPHPYNKGVLGLFVLKGLFDTDGCVSVFNNNNVIYPRIEIRLSPCPAQKQIFQILVEQGFNFKVQNLDRGHIKIRISGKNELIKWFDLVGSSNPIHINKAKQFIDS